MIQYKSQRECRRMPLKIVRRAKFSEQETVRFTNKRSQQTDNQRYAQPLPILAYLQATFGLVNFMRFSEGCLSRKFIIFVCSKLVRTFAAVRGRGRPCASPIAHHGKCFFSFIHKQICPFGQTGWHRACPYWQPHSTQFS